MFAHYSYTNSHLIEKVIALPNRAKLSNMEAELEDDAELDTLKISMRIISTALKAN